MYLNLKFFHICKGAMLRKRVKMICKMQDKKKIEFGNLGSNEGCNTSWTNLKKFRKYGVFGVEMQDATQVENKEIQFWGSRLRFKTPNARCNINKKWRRELIFYAAT